MKRLIVGNGRNGTELGLFYFKEGHEITPIGRGVTAHVTSKEPISNHDETRHGFRFELLIIECTNRVPLTADGDRNHGLNVSFSVMDTIKKMKQFHSYDLTINIVYVKSLARDVPFIKCSPPYERDEEPSKMMDPLRCTKEYLCL